MASRPAAGGGIWVRVAPERVERWCAGFAERHGGIVKARVYDTGEAAADEPGDDANAALEAIAGPAPEPQLRLIGADGAIAACVIPFPPLPPPSSPATAASIGASTGATGSTASQLIEALARHAALDRRIGVLLVRRGGYAAGIFEGERLLAHKVGARHVQGKTKAGGWSQQRYARRREGQARQAYAAAADAAEQVILPQIGNLDAVVAGGDANAVAALKTEPVLSPLWAKLTGPLIEVGDPKRDDLQRAPESFRAVRIRVIDPTP